MRTLRPWTVAVLTILALPCRLAALPPAFAAGEGVVQDKAAWDRLFDGAQVRPYGVLSVAGGVRAARPQGYPAELIDALRRAEALNLKEGVWPGYSVFGQPILIYDPSNGAALVGHPSPPPGYKAVSGAAPLAFWKPGASIPLRATFAFHMDVSGTDTFAYRLGMMDAMTEDAATIVHERFHVFQEQGRFRHRYASAMETGPDDLALAELETRALERAIKADSPSARAHNTRLFIALRRERYRQKSPFQGTEESEESNEGMARYVELRLTPAIGPGQTAEELLLKNLSRPGGLDRMGKWRSYGVGAAQGFLLDLAGDPGWKRDVGAGATVFSLLQKDYPLPADQQEAFLSQARSELGYDLALRKASDEVESFKARRKAAWEKYLAQTGVEFYLAPPGELSSGGFSFSSGMFILEDGSWFLPGLEKLAASHPGYELYVGDRPAINGPEHWRFFIPEDASVVLDGRSIRLAPGTFAFSTLKMKAPDFELSTSYPGRLVYEGGRLRIEWSSGAAGLVQAVSWGSSRPEEEAVPVLYEPEAGVRFY